MRFVSRNGLTQRRSRWDFGLFVGYFYHKELCKVSKAAVRKENSITCLQEIGFFISKLRSDTALQEAKNLSVQ
jgi:hypothetical protein